jgi:hypothetical protein
MKKMRKFGPITTNNDIHVYLLNSQRRLLLLRKFNCRINDLDEIAMPLSTATGQLGKIIRIPRILFGASIGSVAAKPP